MNANFGLNLSKYYSINFDLPKRSKKKIIFIILHYTGMKTESAAIKRLRDHKSKVSSHYFIKNNGEVLSLVPDLYEAWHAGVSSWQKLKSLNKYSIGLAHHKVIHLLSMYEGISISELLKRLKVTKQSLNRVLKDLIKLEIITFKRDDQDTRIKHVFLNDKGKKIFNEIFELQKKRVYGALLNSSSEEVINFDNVLSKIING